MRAVSGNEVAGQAKPEIVSATPVKAWESTITNPFFLVSKILYPVIKSAAKMPKKMLLSFLFDSAKKIISRFYFWLLSAILFS